MRLNRTGCSACRMEQFNSPFTMAFQPIVDIVQHRIDSHEALVRGVGGESAGAMFAEVSPENLYAFDQACRVKAINMASKLRLQKDLCINFLPNAIYDPRACIRKTLETASRTGFPLDLLTFEFNETERIFDNEYLLTIIKEFRSHGFKIAIDDFGTSHSGLSRLIDLRPDIIKLDQKFVRNIETDPVRQAIVAGIVRIGLDIGIKVVVEGVERPEEVEAARLAGARYLQGFFFSAPIFEGIAQEVDITWPVIESHTAVLADHCAPADS